MQQSIPSYQQRDAHWMHQALLEAKKAGSSRRDSGRSGHCAEEQVIAQGAHNRRELDQDAMAHAEVLCIQQACRVLTAGG